MHAPGSGLRCVFTPSDIGEDQQRVPVKTPVTAQFLIEAGGQRQYPIPMSLAVSNEEFVLVPFNVVNGQSQALTESQSAGVDESLSPK